jgi:hypothetical protein
MTRVSSSDSRSSKEINTGDADPGGVLTGSRAEGLGIVVAPLPGRVRERDEEVPAVQP